MMRDMTNGQYKAALKRHGFRQEPFGYVRVTDRLIVHPANAGKNRRARLAYLISRADESREKPGP